MQSTNICVSVKQKQRKSHKGLNIFKRICVLYFKTTTFKKGTHPQLSQKSFSDS